MPSPNDFKSRFDSKDPNALPDLRAFLESRVQQKGDHLEWALLCEALGFPNLASREFQLECRDNPQGPHARFKMALLHREKGEVEKALAILDQLLQTHPWKLDWIRLAVEILAEEGSTSRAKDLLEKAEHQGVPVSELKKITKLENLGEKEPDDSLHGLAPADSDCTRFLSLFSGRENIYARQWAAREGDAGYSPVEEPLTPAVIRNHLLGGITVGIYPIRLDGTCTFFALDLDITKAALEKATGNQDASRQLRASIRSTVLFLADKFLEQGLVPLLEDSGYKGRHLWFFLEHPETAETLHKLGQLILAWLSPLLPEGLHLEFFPKQGSLKGKGLGNLIKVPLGIHRRTGRRALLLDSTGNVLQHPFVVLRSLRKIARNSLLGLFDFLKALPAPQPLLPATSIQKNKSTTLVSAGPVMAAPVPPAWTEDDFLLEPRVSHLFANCPVLRALKDKVDSQRSLTHEEQLVLIHTLGHLDAGPLAVNFLLRKCIDVGPGKLMGGTLMGDKLKGSPTACANIRKRIPHITRLVSCNCAFDQAPDRYPSPVLHLLSLPVVQDPGIADSDLPALAARYVKAREKLLDLNHEIDLLSSAIISHLNQLPLAGIDLPEGALSLIPGNDKPQLTFVPKKPGDDPANS